MLRRCIVQLLDGAWEKRTQGLLIPSGRGMSLLRVFITRNVKPLLCGASTKGKNMVANAACTVRMLFREEYENFVRPRNMAV